MEQTTYRTKYYGIDVVQQETATGSDWYILDGAGCDTYLGKTKPTPADIDRFRAESFPDTCTHAELKAALPEARI